MARNVLRDTLECVTSSGALPEDLGQNPLSQSHVLPNTVTIQEPVGTSSMTTSSSTRCEHQTPQLCSSHGMLWGQPVLSLASCSTAS